MHHPDLRHLALRAARPTGGNAEGKKPANAAHASEHSEFPYDLITTVLTSLRRNDVEEACRAAARWCNLNKTHQRACKNDPNMWKALIRIAFPQHPPIAQNANAEAEFFRACTEWQKAEMRATQNLKWGAIGKTNKLRYEVHKNSIEFRDDRERALSALVKRAEELLSNSKRFFALGVIDQHLKDLVRDAIDNVFLARVPDGHYGNSWQEAPKKFERIAARLAESVRMLQAKVDARERLLSPQPMPPDVANAPNPMEVDSPGAGPSGTSVDSSDDEAAYDSEDEPATPPGFY